MKESKDQSPSKKRPTPKRTRAWWTGGSYLISIPGKVLGILRWKGFRLFAAGVATAVVVSIVGGLIMTWPILEKLYGYYRWAQEFDMEQVTKMPETSFVYDRNGEVLQRLFEEYRLPVTSEEIPDRLRHAVIATEDERFYLHFGFDPISIFRAATRNVFSGRIGSGASTISQQLARNSANIFERTLPRKIKEVFLAMRIEQQFTKEEILTLYLNRIFYGSRVYGIGAAAESYFGKKPGELTISECAMLAGIISGPNSFSPWHNPELAREARDRSIHRMLEEEYITPEEAKAALAEPLHIRPRMDIPSSHAVSAILDALPEGFDSNITTTGGIRIYSTIDKPFQEAAEKGLNEALTGIESERSFPHQTRKKYLSEEPGSRSNPEYLQGAFVAIHNEDGGILALVGGRSFEESSFNRATFGERQVGSTLKPFVYANLFDQRNAAAFTLINVGEFDLHQPDFAFSSGKNNFVPIRQALETSNNFASMRAVLAGGVEEFADLVQRASGQPIPAFPSSALGACELTPLQLTSAYTVFPNQGVLIEPHLISRIESADGEILYRHYDQSERVLSEETAFQVVSILKGVVDHGTAARLRHRYGFKKEPLAGKTGTTDDYKDGWFVGFNRNVTAGVWVGLDQPQRIMYAGYSNRTALPPWAAIMKEGLRLYPSEDFEPPPTLKLAQRTEETSFLFFKSISKKGQPEYVPMEKETSVLAKVDSPLRTVTSWSEMGGESPFGFPRPTQRREEDFWESLGNFLFGD